MQHTQASRRGSHIALEVFAVIWFLGYLGTILWFPSLGRLIDSALRTLWSAVVVWIAMIGVPFISTILFYRVGTSRYTRRSEMFWKVLMTFVACFGLMAIVMTMVTGGGWITFLNLNTPPLDQLPAGYY
ncbi:hypothetical protein [Schleiferilactobacillus shenzhenensis]|uniref:hypothetical protein n=1 Tax=Schleiferilactobacillus shenzhenensis TaxID=1231337 RepID=UPI00058B473B|nr:hypothetical protein [Schleiferilactobacillus shenzhenensis]